VRDLAVLHYCTILTDNKSRFVTGEHLCISQRVHRQSAIINHDDIYHRVIFTNFLAEEKVTTLFVTSSSLLLVSVLRMRRKCISLWSAHS